MKKLLISFLLASFAVLSFPQLALADGMIVPPPGYWIEETDQQAVIFHQGNLETLILSITFRGDAEDFGWIIPLPTRPEIDKSTDELFVALKELTQYRPRQQIGKKIDLPSGDSAESQVTVWETKRVGIYQTAVITSTNKDALAQWLDENGYHYPTSYAYILDDYINRGWYFVAAKINTDSLNTLVEGQLREGHVTPLQLTFKTDKPFYPLKISSVTSAFLTRQTTATPTPVATVRPIRRNDPPEPIPDKPHTRQVPGQQGQGVMEDIVPVVDRRASNVGVTLYIFSDHKSYLPSFNTLYAGWLKERQIENLAQIDGDPWINVSKGKYLTRIHRQYRLEEMNNDLWIRYSEDDQPVGGGQLKLPFLGENKKFLLIVGFTLVLEVLAVGAILLSLTKVKNEPNPILE
jgi:hypothetical protein